LRLGVACVCCERGETKQTKREKRRIDGFLVTSKAALTLVIAI